MELSDLYSAGSACISYSSTGGSMDLTGGSNRSTRGYGSTGAILGTTGGALGSTGGISDSTSVISGSTGDILGSMGGLSGSAGGGLVSTGDGNRSTRGYGSTVAIVGTTGGALGSTGGISGCTSVISGSTGGILGSMGGLSGSAGGGLDSTGDGNSRSPEGGTAVRPGGLLAKLGLPCQVEEGFQYEQCYSYYANGCYNTCQFVQFGDMEDFMNHERRKEKSRDAARCRRSRETEIFTDLATSLPLSNEQVTQLDKASIMRLAISYLKVREMISLVPDLSDPEEKIGTDGSVFLKSLDGFIVVLSVDGDFIYLSENVCDYLGLSQIDLMGQNIFDYSHPCDHEEIREILSGKTKDGDEGPKSLFIRMKCTLTSKGRSVNLKSAIYKVIQCKGRMIKHPNLDENCNDEVEERGGLQSCFMAVGQPIPHPSNIETPLSKQTFLTKHSLDMKFTHADDDMLQDLLGYDADDLVGKSVYDYHHALDSEAILSSCKCLFSKGQCETPRYRFLAKTGGYVWVVTQATLIYDKVQKPQSVVCVNYVVSGWECKDEIYSAGQYSSVKSEAIARAAAEPDAQLEETTDGVSGGDLEEAEEAPPHSPQKPKNATCEIFGPRTKDMSKGFLTFSEEDSGLTMLKEEPDDLTHLAPTAGDVCIPLDEQHPYLSDMLEDIFLPDGFNTLLVDGPSDPFISYRDYQNASPQLLSPNLSKQSDCSLPSLNSPSDSCIDEEQMSTFMNLQMNEDTTEMALKAPFIHTILNDDRPMLISNDLMWSDGETKKTENSSLAQLLCNSKVNKVNNDSGSDEDFYTDKTCRTSWPVKQTRVQGSKRPIAASCEPAPKRPRSQPKEQLSSELLHQLMASSAPRGRDTDKSGWKAACVSQPSDSVLMNLLDDPMASRLVPLGPTKHESTTAQDRRRLMRRASIGLLDPDAGSIASLMDLTQLDYEVNAPASFGLLQGQDLLSALDVSACI